MRPSSMARSGLSSGRHTPPAATGPRREGSSSPTDSWPFSALPPSAPASASRDTTSRPRAAYGGWLSADTLSRAHADALTEEVLRAPSLIWRRSPADREATAVSIPGAIEEVTHLVDLSDGADAAGRRWRSEARGSANRARKAGVKVREAKRPDDWLAYDALYREALGALE